jgi:hypothetical protein
MFTLYNFHFLDTVSQQLLDKLNTLSVSPLNLEELNRLRIYEKDNHSRKGVYLLHYQQSPVYLGKADDIAERLQQHYNKLCGRQNISISEMGFKCIILDESMSTAANEELLISLFQKDHNGMWNNSGFGAKDPGKQRDQTKPGEFDQKYPINSKYKIQFSQKTSSVNYFLNQAKQQLPYVFRFEIPSEQQQISMTVSDTELSAEDFLKELLSILGRDFQANILSFGITLYAEEKKYAYGKSIRNSSEDV